MLPDPFYVLQFSGEFYFYSTGNYRLLSHWRGSTPATIRRLLAQAGEGNLYTTSFNNLQRTSKSITTFFYKLHWLYSFYLIHLLLRRVKFTHVSKISNHLQSIHGHTYTCKNHVCWSIRLSCDTSCYYLSIHQYLIYNITANSSWK